MESGIPNKYLNISELIFLRRRFVEEVLFEEGNFEMVISRFFV